MYAVITSTKTAEATRLTVGTFSKKAKSIPLTTALHIAQGQQANVYTDSKFAFLIAHTHLSFGGKGLPHYQGHTYS